MALGVILRLGGAYFYYDWFDFFSVIPVLAGICLLLAGWHALAWSWPAIVFLVFMIPMPFRLETAMAQPLQQIATRLSTYALQTLGLPALAEGHTIHLEEFRIGVVEACSGLRMLMVFFALATGVAIVIDRPLWERVVLLASAIPIALVSNVVRITITGALYGMGMGSAADIFFHDVAGWFMMPLALGLLGLELWILSHLFLEPEQSAPVSLSPLDIRMTEANGSAAKRKADEPAQRVSAGSQAENKQRTKKNR